MKGPWTLPNFITLLRLAALPFFLLSISEGGSESRSRSSWPRAFRTASTDTWHAGSTCDPLSAPIWIRSPTSSS